MVALCTIMYSLATQHAPIYVSCGLSLQIERGEKIALVGHSGAGKLAVIQLLMRFYTASAGEIRINSVNINKFDITHLRANIGIVPQDVLLLAEQ